MPRATSDGSETLRMHRQQNQDDMPDSHSKVARPTSRWKKAAFVLGALLVGLGLTGLGAEVVVRVVFPQVDAERWFESDPRYGYVLRKNFHQTYRYPQAGVTYDVFTNSMGLRDKEYDLSRTDTRRVLLLGDSFTFGEGLAAEFNFDSKLEALLSASPDPWYVLNAGIGGWGTLQETTYARDHFADFDPDVVVLTFCGNDPTDDLKFLSGMRDIERGSFYFPGKAFVRNHSHLYRLIFYRFRGQLQSWLLRSRVAEQQKVVVDKQSQGVVTRESWERTREMIEAFRTDFLAFKPEGFVLLQATNPLHVRTREFLQSLSNGRDLIYVDLHDEALELGRAGMRMAHDGHWSEKMHEISARAIFGAIRAVLDRGSQDSQ